MPQMAFDTLIMNGVPTVCKRIAPLQERQSLSQNSIARTDPNLSPRPLQITFVPERATLSTLNKIITIIGIRRSAEMAADSRRYGSHDLRM